MADKAQPDEHRQQKEDIEDFGTVALTQGAHVIHCLTVIGQIEGHTEAPQGQKTTKYEHVIPQLVAVQEDPPHRGAAGAAEHGGRRCGSGPCTG